MTTKPRILILGSTGQLGRELQRSFADAGYVIARGRDTGDLSRPDQLRAIVRDAAPQLILNAAAYTAVDRAESEPELARAVNAHAPAVLAEEALRANALFIHYSTDYVFDGSKTAPWVETDAAHPLNVYGQTKLEGEQAVQQIGGRSLIFRTSWVYGPHGKNFLLTMLRLGSERKQLRVVDDQIGAPTSSIQLADATRRIADQFLTGNAPADSAGIYHMACAGSTSWCGFARAIFAQAERLLHAPAPEVVPIPSSEFPTPARRPGYSVLSGEKLFQTFGVRLAPWQAALEEVMARLAQ